MAIIVLYILILISVIIGVYIGRYLLNNIYGKDYTKSRIFLPLDQTLSKMQKMLIIWLPISVALLCVIIYRIFSEKKISDFILFGCISVVFNLLIVSIIVFSKRGEFVMACGGLSVAILYTLTLIMPFFIYYIMLSLAFLGFKIPFSY